MASIYIIDADQDRAEELRRGFQALCVDVDVANHPIEALERISIVRPELILLTIELPVMNGYSVCHKLRKNPQTKEIPLIILSSEDSEETFEQHRKLRTRADAYVHLPTTFGELFEAIQFMEPVRNILLERSDGQVKQVPPEICNQGISAIVDYLQRARRDGVPLYEAKLLVVGSGGVGKTSLCRRLLAGEFNEAEPTTRGVDVGDHFVVHGWSISAGREAEAPIKLNVWDFGGQELYHSTHRFFLSRRSLYVLVWDSRHETSLFQLEYWLRTIESFAGDSPVILVQNKCDERVDDINLRDLREQFPQIRRYLRVSCKMPDAAPDSLTTLRAEIARTASALDHMGSLWFSAWIRIRETLHAEPRPFISLDDYLALCAAERLAVREALQLCEYLHDLGVVIHFADDPVLRQLLILKPHWGTAAVYRILESQAVRDSLGVLSEAQAALIWTRSHGYPPSVHLMLFRLMASFQLAFRIAESDDYLVPELLPEQPPPEASDVLFGANVVFEYVYNFLPPGIIPQFIVRIHDVLARADGGRYLYWRSGALISGEGSRALIYTSPMARRLVVQVSGPHALDLLAIIRRELDGVNRKYAKLSVHREVCCPCDDGCTYRWSYDVLRGAYQRRMRTLPCQHSFKQVSVLRVLGGVDSLPDERISVYNYGQLNTGDQYSTSITSSNVGALAAGSGARAHAHGQMASERAAPWFDRALLRAEIASIQKALIDDQDALDEVAEGMGEALMQFLRTAREITNEAASLTDLNIRIKSAFDDILGHLLGDPQRIGALLNTFSVGQAMRRSPAFAAVT